MENYAFQDRMQDGRDAARRNIESLAYLGGRVTWKRPAAKELWSVETAAARLGVTTRRIRALLARGAVSGATRGNGRAWRIPAHRQPDGSYALAISPGKRGPKMRVSLSESEPPF
jgi:hypothetical protein